MSMQNPSTVSHSKYTESRLEGLRRHTAQQRQATLERLRAAIASLQAKAEPITANSIWAESDLEYTAIRRNPEALALFQKHSNFLADKQEEKTPQVRDSLLAYKKTQLAKRLRQEMQHREVIEMQNRQLLEERTQYHLRVMQLEAELANRQNMLNDLRAQMLKQESEKGRNIS